MEEETKKSYYNQVSKWVILDKLQTGRNLVFLPPIFFKVALLEFLSPPSGSDLVQILRLLWALWEVKIVSLSGIKKSSLI